MKMRLLLGALSILALSVTPVFAEESLEERVKRLEEALQKAQDGNLARFQEWVHLQNNILWRLGQ